MKINCIEISVYIYNKMLQRDRVFGTIVWEEIIYNLIFLSFVE